MAGLTGDYLGMTLTVTELDIENTEYFKHCAAHDFHLQQCSDCGVIRYPPGAACHHCGSLRSSWVPVEGKGTVHSYCEVHHGIQPAFKQRVPYMTLLVELDTQKGKPGAEHALRVGGNLTTADGTLAPPEMIKQIGIGSRMKMVFADVSEGLSLPQWTLDADAKQPDTPWRYPQE
jgi:uncharacterized OB-fold protein